MTTRKTQTSSDAVKTAAEGETAAGALSSAAATTSRTDPMSLEVALATLDTDDDSLWTSEGLPRIEVLESLTGGKVTRADVELVSPGFSRAKAKEPAEEPEPAGASEKVFPTKEAPAPAPTDATGEYVKLLAQTFGWPSLEDLRRNSQ